MTTEFKIQPSDLEPACYDPKRFRVRDVRFSPVRLAASIHQRDALLELFCVCSRGVSIEESDAEEPMAIKRRMASIAPRLAATPQPGRCIVACTGRRWAFSRRSSQIDRHGRTAVHFELGRAGADPPLRAGARRVVRARPAPPPSAPVRRQWRYGCCLAIVMV
jgi:hypothetical protein